MPETLYHFRVKHLRTGKWYQARYAMTLEHAKSVFGAGNYELISGSEDVREPITEGAAHVQQGFT